MSEGLGNLWYLQARTLGKLFQEVFRQTIAELAFEFTAAATIAVIIKIAAGAFSAHIKGSSKS